MKEYFQKTPNTLLHINIMVKAEIKMQNKRAVSGTGNSTVIYLHIHINKMKHKTLKMRDGTKSK